MSKSKSQPWVIQIGQQYYKADDEDLVDHPDCALQFDNFSDALANARLIAETWDIDSSTIAVVQPRTKK